MEMNYASKSTGDAALATGIVGTTLGVLNMANNGGLIGGIGGNAMGAAAGAAVASAIPNIVNPHTCQCSENQSVNRYEFTGAMDYERQINELRLKLAESNADVKLRDATIYTDKKLVEVYSQTQRDIKDAVSPIESRVKQCEEAIYAQAVYNGVNSTMVNTIKGQIDGLTKLVIPNSSVCPGWGDVQVTPVTPTP